jgi:hypothetical protein
MVSSSIVATDPVGCTAEEASSGLVFVHCRQLETLGSDSLNVADRAAFDALIRAFASTQQVALREFTASP